MLRLGFLPSSGDKGEHLRSLSGTFRLIPSQGRSYYEIDILFERRISARKFSSTIVERDADEHEREQHGLPRHG